MLHLVALTVEGKSLKRSVEGEARSKKSNVKVFLDGLSLTTSIPDIQLILAVQCAIMQFVNSMPQSDAPAAPVQRLQKKSTARPEGRAPHAKTQHVVKCLVRLKQLVLGFLEEQGATTSPVFNMALPEVVVEATVHLPQVAYIASADLLLSIDSYNRQMSAWEPVVEEYGLLVTSKRHRLPDGRPALAIDCRAVNVLNIKHLTRVLVRHHGRTQAAAESVESVSTEFRCGGR